MRIDQKLNFNESGLYMTFGITDKGQLRLLHFSAEPYREELDENFHDGENSFLEDGYVPVQMQIAGLNRPWEKQGNMWIGTEPGTSLRYVSHKVEDLEDGKLIIFVQEDASCGIRVWSMFRLFSGLSCVRISHEVENYGTQEQTIEYLGSFSYLGLEKEGDMSSDDKILIHMPYNGWQKELSWRSHTLPELGLSQTQPHVMRRTSRNIVFSNTGNWSTKDYIPMAIIENRQAGHSLFFQIEHNGSWMWEMGMQNNHIYLNVSGPEDNHHHFVKHLAAGSTFLSVPVCVGVSEGGTNEAVQQLTRYRRLIRRPNADNENLPVIFNDYMNCLFGDPTTQNERPLIQAAREAGCEYYVIDAGWYAKGSWWDGVGEWKECRERFPEGLSQLTSEIRAKGMTPGLWLELEVMGIHCPLLEKCPENWFFRRHGKPVYDRSRLQLDFRNPLVRAFADSVIDRLVQEYGAGYIKMDYNIEPGTGTEVDSDSVGEGLLEHERAYLSWLDRIFERYPALVIENCSSGGMRMDYAMLSRYSIQSTSDQEDYLHYSTIACNAPSAVTPEQAAVWSYPMRDADAETAIFNMVNAMMGRIHQSGHLAELAPEALRFVKQGIQVYRTMRLNIREAVPAWPLGFAHTEDPFVALVLRFKTGAYLAVWNRWGSQEASFTVPLSCAGKVNSVSVLYPSDDAIASASPFVFRREEQCLDIRMSPKTARIFELR